MLGSVEYLLYFRHGAIHAIENRRRRTEVEVEQPRANIPLIPGGDFPAFEAKLLMIGAILVLNNLFKGVAPFEEMIIEAMQLDSKDVIF